VQARTTILQRSSDVRPELFTPRAEDSRETQRDIDISRLRGDAGRQLVGCRNGAGQLRDDPGRAGAHRLLYRCEPHQPGKVSDAAGVARQQSDIAIYRSVTGTYPRKKMRRTRPAP
jgi:hypothetical protein